jgi:CDK inhibitor PHO81
MKYPTNGERDKLGLSNLLPVNAFVDNVLKTVYDAPNPRSVIFASLNPSVCTAINWKQPNYGVFFKTRAGFGVEHGFENDKRCNSIKEAIRFSKKSNFLGIMCEAAPLVIFVLFFLFPTY